MCMACGVPTHVPQPEEQSVLAPPGAPDASRAAPAEPAPRKFAALRNRDCRPYLFGTGLAMMADNIEHVITYWVLWEKFHSPALAGFEVISHWVPFLAFSIWFGSLADRFDCRRVVQSAQLLFMAVSVAWGVLFLTNSLHMWEACVLLVLHGLAGALWAPGEQLMLHDFVGPAELPSAVRLNATFRSLGILFGPVVGSALLLGLGPIAGIFVNVAFYLPLTLFLFRTRFTGHTRDGHARPRVGVVESLRVLREVSADRTLVSMIVLAGLGSFFVGASMQTSMPIFANDFGGAGGAGSAYGVLLFANGAGGVLGGLLLEATGRVKPNVPVAVISHRRLRPRQPGLRADQQLPAGTRPAAGRRGGEPGLDGGQPDRGPAARARRRPGPGDRRVRDVGQRAPHGQRLHRGAARRGDRRALVARPQLGGAVRRRRPRRRLRATRSSGRVARPAGALVDGAFSWSTTVPPESRGNRGHRRLNLAGPRRGRVMTSDYDASTDRVEENGDAPCSGRRHQRRSPPTGSLSPRRG